MQEIYGNYHHIIAKNKVIVTKGYLAIFTLFLYRVARLPRR